MTDCGMPIDKVGHGMSAGGMSAGAMKTNAVVGCGLSAGSKKPRATRKKKVIEQPTVENHLKLVAI